MQLNSDDIQALRKNSLFQDLSKADFASITENTQRCELKTDEVLFRQMSSAEDFFFLAKGKVKLYLLSVDGTEKVVDIINEGNTFAEAVMFKGIPQFPVNAETLSDSTILRINSQAYLNILSKSPQTCIKVMGCLSVRLHWLMNELDRLSLHNATYRLISYLLENIPSDSTESTEVNLSIPKHVVASRISVTPETLSRTLKRLSQEGLLEVHDKHIVINNPQELRSLVSI